MYYMTQKPKEDITLVKLKHALQILMMQVEFEYRRCDLTPADQGRLFGNGLDQIDQKLNRLG